LKVTSKVKQNYSQKRHVFWKELSNIYVGGCVQERGKQQLMTIKSIQLVLKKNTIQSCVQERGKQHLMTIKSIQLLLKKNNTVSGTYN